MDTLHVAPLLRGLALAAGRPSPGGFGSAVVASRILSAAEPPPGVPLVELDAPAFAAEGGEAALVDALRAALPPGSGPRFLLAVRAASETRLYAAAPSLGEARALLEGRGTKPGPASPAPGGGEAALAAAGAAPAGAAAARHRVVEGKVALVTGGAQGFGEEIVRGLAASGALVYVADMNVEGATRLARSLDEAAGRTVALPLPMDVSSEDSVREAFAAVAATTGGLDLVVSNAGVLRAGGVLDQDLAAFDLVTRVNYTGFFLVAKHSGRLLRLQNLACPGLRSDIVQVNSKSGLAGSNRNGAYAGSKFGGIGLVQSFALELVEHGVKVNAICPGNFFDGPLWSDPEKGLFTQYLRAGKVKGARTVADVRAAYEAKVPMGRGCEGPDVMRALYYLVEQEYETGQALPVTGGQVMLA